MADNFGVGSKNGIHTNASELSFLGGKAWIVLGGGHGTGTTVGCSVRAVGLLLSAPGTEDLTNANVGSFLKSQGAELKFKARSTSILF